MKDRGQKVNLCTACNRYLGRYGGCGCPTPSHKGLGAADMEILTTTFAPIEDVLPETTNPKAALGDLKAPFFGVPPTALIQLGLVMATGAHKYGVFNYRDTTIKASTYIDAINRHFLKWQDGVDTDPESGAHELAHIMACCALCLDAYYNDRLEDDRSKTGNVEALLDKAAETFLNFKENYNGKVAS